MPNRHPVDQLADVRSEIKILKEREQALSAPRCWPARTSMSGDENEATILELAVEHRRFRSDEARIRHGVSATVPAPANPNESDA